jgi:hypothetical protein
MGFNVVFPLKSGKGALFMGGTTFFCLLFLRFLRLRGGLLIIIGDENNFARKRYRHKLK